MRRRGVSAGTSLPKVLLNAVERRATPAMSGNQHCIEQAHCHISDAVADSGRRFRFKMTVERLARLPQKEQDEGDQREGRPQRDQLFSVDIHCT